MGAADVVPGVSGGTIAFITGIYDQLLSSINAISLDTLKVLRKDGFKAAWNKINGSFLIALVAGIGLSVLSLARLLKTLLETHPSFIWGFFFGLVLGSIYLVRRLIDSWTIVTLLSVVVGTVISYYLTIIEPGGEAHATWFIFLAGMVAICAMILPGISGAFILLIMGVYYPMLEAISTFDLKFIAILGSGAVIGLLSFSRFLKWLLDNYYDMTVAMLLGFLIGSLNKLWPWKETIRTRLNSHGEEVPFIQENIWPTELPGTDIALVFGVAVVGLVIILLLSKYTPDESK